MNKLIFGRYIPGDSFIHRLDPRAKLLASFYFIGIIFLANNWQSYVLIAAFTAFAISLSKISARFFIRGVRPLLWLILFTVALQTLFTQGGEVYFQWGIISITQFGVTNGLFIFCRFVLIIFMSTLLTLTTAPLELSDAIEYLLRPLRVVKFPVHEVSLMLSIALRFVPTLMDETEKIMNAQRARGVDFGEGNLLQKMKAIVHGSKRLSRWRRTDKIPHSSLAPTRYNSNVWLCLVNHWLICIKNLEKVNKNYAPL